MLVRELKQIAPVENLYELNDDARYLIQLPGNLSMAEIENAVRGLKQAGIRGVIFSGEVKFFEFQDTPDAQPNPNA